MKKTTKSYTVKNFKHVTWYTHIAGNESDHGIYYSKNLLSLPE